MTDQSPSGDKVHIIVVGNEKGGAGKTTVSMHLITSLLELGFSVGSIDLDSRQRSLSRYIENRLITAKKTGRKLSFPTHAIVNKSPFETIAEIQKDEECRLEQCITRLSQDHDFVVIDTPGSDTFLSRYAHSQANTIVTPINDSFVDLDVLVRVDGNKLDIERPGIYSEMIWEQKLKRARFDREEIRWIVMRNRLSSIGSRNKEHMADVLQKLSRRLGARIIPGFSERVIFRGLFLQGLTLLDVIKEKSQLTMSHIAARKELRDFLTLLQVPAITERLPHFAEGVNKKADKKEEMEPA